MTNKEQYINNKITKNQDMQFGWQSFVHYFLT